MYKKEKQERGRRVKVTVSTNGYVHFWLIFYRPKAIEVLHHPLFWRSETRLSFLRDTSDRVELEDRESDSDLLKALESIAPIALGGKWDEKMEPSFLTNIGRYRRYKFDSVRDLLRVIRNKFNHYRELPQEIQVHFHANNNYISIAPFDIFMFLWLLTIF